MLTAVGCGGSSGKSSKDAGGEGGIPLPDGSVPVGANLTVSTPSVDFGTVDVGSTSAPSNITVTNQGPGKSGPLTVEVSGAGLKVSGCNGTALEANKTCVIAVTVTPSAAGQITGTVRVYDTADKPKSVNVTGNAVTPGAFSLSPSPLDLGPVLAGKQASGTVVLTNISTAGLTGLSVTVSGPGFTAGTGSCSEALGVGQSCNILVNFTAGATSGVAKGSVTVSQAGITKTVNVTATVQLPAKLVMTPPSAAFQTVVGTASSAVTFYVANSGDVASAAPTVSISGANKDDFSMTTTCAVALPPAAALPTGCQVVVVYKPMAAPATTSQATLTVAEAGAGGTSATAALTGTALAKSSLTITGTATDMGTVVVGSTGAAFTFTVTNTGGDDTGALKVASTAAQFVVAADNCSDKTLAGKGSCTFTAQFKPAAGDTGVIQGSFKASGANVANPAFLGVTGNAVPQAQLVADPKVLEFHSVPRNQESTPLTLTVSNNGGAPTGALKVDNTGAQFSIKADNCSTVSLTAAGATKSCLIVVTFTPTGLTTVDSTGSIIVTDTTGAAGSVSASLHGTGVDRPDVSLSPSIVCPASGDATCTSTPKFANMVVGKTSAVIPFTVTNETSPSVAADSGTLSFAFSGDAAADFAIVTNNCTAPLVSAATPQTCVVTVSFTPSAVGLRKAFLTLTTSRGSVDKATLEGLGVSALELVPMDADLPEVTGLDLGSTPIGTTGDHLTYRLWVRDTTATDHTTTVTVTLPTPSQPDFAFYGSNGCTGKTLDLSSALTVQNGYTKDGSFWYCDFDVQFTPKSAKGTLSADLTASATGGGSSKLTLTGTSTGPLVVGFGSTQTKPVIITEPVAVGRYTDKTVTIKNKGLTAQTGLTFGLSGTGAGDFQIVATDCWGVDGTESETHGAGHDALPAVTLAAGNSCTVTVRFAPQTETKYSVVFTATAANGAGPAESDTVAIIANSASTFGALTITPAIANTQFGDIPEASTTAAAVTFTVTNTGSLPAKGLSIASLTEFAVLPSANVPGACAFEDPNLVLAQNAPCTIRVRPVPSATKPAGTDKVAVDDETLSVTTDFGGQSVTVQVPMLYYVTSSIVVKDAGASSTSLAYAFPAAGVNATQTHNFVVTNLGSAAATLLATVAAPYSVAQAPTGTFDPPACVYTAGGLAAGASCTLVLQNLNTIGTSDAETLLTLQDTVSAKTGRATVSLTKKTLADSVIVLKYLDSAPSISLGSVPADSTTASFVGGKATVWFQNDGAIPSAALSFKWDSTSAGTADKEFIIDSDETSCVGKVLQPGALCSMNVHFKYDAVAVPALGLRTKVLKVMDGAKEPAAASLVTFTATATATASLRIEDPIEPIKTGFYQFAGSTLKDEQSTARTFRIVNTTGATQTFTLPSLTHSNSDFIYASTQPANGCKVNGDPTVLDTTTSACSFSVVFSPRTNSPFYKHAAITITDAHGSGDTDDVSASIGLMGKVQQPVTLVLSPNVADFGTVGGGAAVSRSFTVTNTGDVPMATDKVSLTTALGTSPTGVTYAITADACNASRLAAGASCVVTVTATGVSYANDLENVLSVTNADYLGSALEGEMIVDVKDAAAISVTPTTWSFGEVPVTGYSEKAFTIVNTEHGMTSGAVTASLSGKDAAQFAISASTCLASGLAGNAACYVNVALRPTALLADTSDLVATLTLTATPGGTKTVNLTGKPVAALIIQGPASVDLDSSAVGVFTVALANTATATSALKTSLVGAEFMIVNDGCFAHILSPGHQTCDVSVKYIGAASATKKSATLTVDGGSAAKKASVVVNATNIIAESH